MMSTDSLLAHGTINPFISFNGGFTPWENLESFFTSSDPTLPSCYVSKPKLGRYHADSVLDSNEITCQTSPYYTKPNLGSHHAGLDLDQQSQSQKPLEPNLSRYLAEPKPSSETPNPNQDSPCFDKNSPDLVETNQNSPISSSCSGGPDDPNPNEPGQGASAVDDRKRKRMISNRESARRSRVRKQKHVENLRKNVNELKIQTQERSNQLQLMIHQIFLLTSENDRLKTESFILQRKLMELNQTWQLQQLQQQQQQRSYHHLHPPPAASCTPMQIII